jgi:hypothetical protein
MAFLRERYLFRAVVDLLRRITGRSFNLVRQLHSNSWFSHDLIVNSNLVQYLLQTEKNRKDTMANTNITQRFFTWKPKPGKPTYIILIHIVLHCLQYNIHIGANGIQNPNPMTWISPKP